MSSTNSFSIVLSIVIIVMNFVLLSSFPQVSGPQSNTLILDGNITKAQEVPYQAVLFEDGSMVCGGSILSPSHILTAAHCVEGSPQLSRDVMIGIDNLEERNSKRIYSIRKIVMHPEYRKVASIGTRDFAIIFLNDRLEMDTEGFQAKTVSLTEDSYVGQVAIVSGFGDTDPSISSTLLRSVHIPIITNQECKNVFGTLIDSSMLCAGELEGRKGPYCGDSGGPLVIKNGENFIQVGVVSWGKNKAVNGLKKHYSVYGSISFAHKWIIETINKDN